MHECRPSEFVKFSMIAAAGAVLVKLINRMRIASIVKLQNRAPARVYRTAQRVDGACKNRDSSNDAG
jgi:hypothetical protein